jgi:hypothetical protein
MQSTGCAWRGVFANCCMPSLCPGYRVSICGKLLDTSNRECVMVRTLTQQEISDLVLKGPIANERQ